MKYINGGYQVEIDEQTGTKRRTKLSNVKPIQPETFDLKVTGWCNAGCAFCHEKSTTKGLHAEIKPLLSITEDLLPGTEIAIGGGHPLAWPHLTQFLEVSKERGYFCNITINGLHLKKSIDILQQYQAQDLVKGIGISAVTTGLTKGAFNIPYNLLLKNVIGHIINKRFDIYDLAYSQLESCHYDRETSERTYFKNYLDHYLILGYKSFGRGAEYEKEREEYSFEDYQKRIFSFMNFAKKNHIKLSFDNLALEQLKIKTLVPDYIWDNHYMGEDGTFSMYIDAVQQTYAKTSTSRYEDRVSWQDDSLKGFFSTL